MFDSTTNFRLKSPLYIRLSVNGETETANELCKRRPSFFFLTEKVDAKGSFTLTFRWTDDGGHKLQSFSETDLINV